MEEIAKRILMKIGVTNGEKILDFGSGIGTYTIPAAKLAGSRGIVYALDKDKKNLDELMRKIGLEDLGNIKRVDTSGETKIPLEEESIDIVLLYDVFHDYYFPSPEDRRRLLDDIYRILKPDGFLSVWPKHLESEAKEEIENANFYLESKHEGNLIHNDIEVEKGEILNFRKRKKERKLKRELHSQAP